MVSSTSDTATTNTSAYVYCIHSSTFFPLKNEDLRSFTSPWHTFRRSLEKKRSLSENTSFIRDNRQLITTQATQKAREGGGMEVHHTANLHQHQLTAFFSGPYAVLPTVACVEGSSLSITPSPPPPLFLPPLPVLSTYNQPRLRRPKHARMAPWRLLHAQDEAKLLFSLVSIILLFFFSHASLLLPFRPFVRHPLPLCQGASRLQAVLWTSLTSALPVVKGARSSLLLCTLQPPSLHSASHSSAYTYERSVRTHQKKREAREAKLVHTSKNKTKKRKGEGHGATAST